MIRSLLVLNGLQVSLKSHRYNFNVKSSFVFTVTSTNFLAVGDMF